MQQYQNYTRAINASAEESLAKINNKIPNNSIVLDVGCGSGMLGQYLSQEKKCVVDGVDFDEAAIEICSPSYRFTAVKNLEVDLLTDVFASKAYDYIVVADVIEHLVNPDKMLSELKKLIKPDGTIIFSVPNITHIAVGFEMLFGCFEYRNNGLLDNTHLRFYSKQSLLNKLEAFGHYAFELDTIQKEIAETEFSNHISKFFPGHWVDALISNREDALTYQWLISTKTHPNVAQNKIKVISPCTSKPPLIFNAELYWADKDSLELTERNKLIGHLISENKESTIIDFYFSECASINCLQQIRINPVSEQKYFLIANAEILDREKNVVWTWEPKTIGDEIHGVTSLNCFDSKGCLFQTTSSDPQWYPAIDKEILFQVRAGWIFRLSLKTDNLLLKELISNFQQRENLSNELQALRLSTSWRITKPLRKVSQWGKPFMRFVWIYRNYRKIYPGFSGFQRLARQSVNAIKKGGIKGLRNKVSLHERITHGAPVMEHAALQKCNASQIDLLNTYIDEGLIVNPTIIFDHNGGGGSNLYTDKLVKDINANGGTILRVYCFDAVWFVQWFGDGMLFNTSSIEELFKVLSKSSSQNIIINSVYGYPDVEVAIANIITLAQTQNATLDYKVHDFYALCPSPHLSDFEEKYCGVPQDIEICRLCLKKNHHWYHNWFPQENKPIDIITWRQPFDALFKAVTTISVFDSSAIEILDKAFSLEESKIRIAPHETDYFKCEKQIDLSCPLHIGVLGTLSVIKGGDVVNALYDYIDERKLNIPVTIVGSSYVATHPKITVYGNYTVNDLPTIISKLGIHVILMPSIIPETFSYIISEAMKMGLPIVAFDIGAQGNRVKQYERGKVVPLGSPSDVILAAIQSALITAQELKK